MQTYPGKEIEAPATRIRDRPERSRGTATLTPQSSVDSAQNPRRLPGPGPQKQQWVAKEGNESSASGPRRATQSDSRFACRDSQPIPMAHVSHQRASSSRPAGCGQSSAACMKRHLSQEAGVHRRKVWLGTRETTPMLCHNLRSYLHLQLKHCGGVGCRMTANITPAGHCPAREERSGERA